MVEPGPWRPEHAELGDTQFELRPLRVDDDGADNRLHERALQSLHPALGGNDEQWLTDIMHRVGSHQQVIPGKRASVRTAALRLLVCLASPCAPERSSRLSIYRRLFLVSHFFFLCLLYSVFPFLYC